ncbi:hypothetical protein [Guillardia theta]|uniref:Uncharacterized protein n=1 Tax=Guillardia theta TaxID=55529 RepID=Q9XG38_GUITH|nr:hypothetical protein GTHECHR2133 [Guillardia theta]CAB40404.1 hypothetical protein [Guillardia theta]
MIFYSKLILNNYKYRHKTQSSIIFYDTKNFKIEKLRKFPSFYFNKINVDFISKIESSFHKFFFLREHILSLNLLFTTLDFKNGHLNLYIIPDFWNNIYNFRKIFYNIDLKFFKEKNTFINLKNLEHNFDLFMHKSKFITLFSHSFERFLVNFKPNFVLFMDRYMIYDYQSVTFLGKILNHSNIISSFNLIFKNIFLSKKLKKYSFEGVLLQNDINLKFIDTHVCILSCNLLYNSIKNFYPFGSLILMLYFNFFRHSHYSENFKKKISNVINLFCQIYVFERFSIKSFIFCRNQQQKTLNQTNYTCLFNEINLNNVIAHSENIGEYYLIYEIKNFYRKYLVFKKQKINIKLLNTIWIFKKIRYDQTLPKKYRSNEFLNHLIYFLTKNVEEYLTFFNSINILKIKNHQNQKFRNKYSSEYV